MKKMLPSPSILVALDLTKKKFREEKGDRESCNRRRDDHAMNLQPHGVYNVDKIRHFETWNMTGDGHQRMRYHTNSKEALFYAKAKCKESSNRFDGGMNSKRKCFSYWWLSPTIKLTDHYGCEVVKRPTSMLC